MTSRKNASSKFRGDRSVPGGSSLRHGNIAPKCPAPFRANLVDGCPSSSCSNELDAIRSFCEVPESVEFRLPVAGEVDESSPDGYFTCFGVYLMQCNLWFPLPDIIVRFFSRFGLGFGHIMPVGLQQNIGILVLSYERDPP
ncbi:hypothetical protein DY000_02030743 [Brassica cretica]|uniref:Uncharacterized protein n=1 Tax=Brassica cretica TaxID=69181 RepID=A0ABQ7DN62_BRACR|nr:hypothetical protein DY000_02030743 [Brassica cretica]